MDMCYGGLDLPPIIQRAICRVNDPCILQDLNPNLRWALSVLLRRVSAVNGKDIFWVKRDCHLAGGRVCHHGDTGITQA